MENLIKEADQKKKNNIITIKASSNTKEIKEELDKRIGILERNYASFEKQLEEITKFNNHDTHDNLTSAYQVVEDIRIKVSNTKRASINSSMNNIKTVMESLINENENIYQLSLRVYVDKLNYLKDELKKLNDQIDKDKFKWNEEFTNPEIKNIKRQLLRAGIHIQMEIVYKRYQNLKNKLDSLGLEGEFIEKEFIGLEILTQVNTNLNISLKEIDIFIFNSGQNIDPGEYKILKEAIKTISYLISIIFNDDTPNTFTYFKTNLDMVLFMLNKISSDELKSAKRFVENARRILFVNENLYKLTKLDSSKESIKSFDTTTEVDFLRRSLDILRELNITNIEKYNVLIKEVEKLVNNTEGNAKFIRRLKQFKNNINEVLQALPERRKKERDGLKTTYILIELAQLKKTPISVYFVFSF